LQEGYHCFYGSVRQGTHVFDITGVAD